MQGGVVKVIYDTRTDMTKDDVIAYLKENQLPKDTTPEDFIEALLKDGRIMLSDYLELQKAIESLKKPILEINLDPEQIVWDIEKWLSYSQNQRILVKAEEEK